VDTEGPGAPPKLEAEPVHPLKAELSALMPKVPRVSGLAV
jgi:hypothetical protein